MDFLFANMKEILEEVNEKFEIGKNILSEYILSPLIGAGIIGGIMIMATNHMIKRVGVMIRNLQPVDVDVEKDSASNLKLEAQKIAAFDGNMINWQRWKSRTECALDGYGYEKVLSDSVYAMTHSKMNKIVFSQLAVATVDGTAFHIVLQFNDEKDGYKAWKALIEWYEGDVVKNEMAEELKQFRPTAKQMEDIYVARTEASQERSKALAMVKSFPEGLLFFNEKNTLISANPKAEEFFEMQFKNLIGKNLKALEVLPWLKPLVDILNKDGASKRVELVLKNGLALEVSTIKIAKEKEGAGTLVVLRNITREKVVERLKTEFVSIAVRKYMF